MQNKKNYSKYAQVNTMHTQCAVQLLHTDLVTMTSRLVLQVEDNLWFLQKGGHQLHRHTTRKTAINIFSTVRNSELG